MAGFQGGESLRQLYAHAGLFVLPSSHEGLPIVLLEALSYGLPVLVSDIPSNLEVVSDPTQVFRLGDIQELSTKIAVVTNVKLNQAQRETLRRDCFDRYDWAEIARSTSAAYDELMDAKSDATLARSKPPRGRDTGPDSVWDELRTSLRSATQHPRRLP
jgi:glycosyltransferase involved in cell wall biosynthesis